MPLWLTIILIILAVVLAVLIILYFVGSKLQKRQAEQQALQKLCRWYLPRLDDVNFLAELG